jgi:alpha-tubulin suppressor-like RCC1 family protein
LVKKPHVQCLNHVKTTVLSIPKPAKTAAPHQVSAGGDHALILMPGSGSLSEAYALGDNSYGQLGAGHNQAGSWGLESAEKGGKWVIESAKIMYFQRDNWGIVN